MLEAGRWTKTVAPRASRLLLGVAAVLSLTAPASTDQDQPPVFRSDVDLVTVDAVVVDSRGQPVSGLTRDDFVVLEEGVPQEIAAFEGVFQPALPESTVVLTPATPAVPRVATNIGAPPEGASFLIVADDIHFSPGGAVLARAALERLLEESLREGDRVAILCTRTGTGWAGTLMEDREDLRAFVSRLRSRARDVGPQLMTELEALRIAEHGDRVTRDRVEGRYWLQKRCYEGPGDCTAVVRADAEALDSQLRLERRESLRTVQSAIERLGRGRGRKAVLFLSESFPHDAGEEPSQRVVRAAERANAAVYFVDVRGVVASPPWATADAPNDAQLNPSRMSPDSVARITDLMARANQSRLAFEKFVGVETIAEDTGGLVLRGNNDLGPALARVSAESRSYYLIGYHPTSPSRDGRFRKIEVRLKRPGLSVRARKGYEPARAIPGEAPRAREAGADATPVTDVPLRLATYTLEPLAGGKTRVLASVEVDFSALTAERRDGRRVAHLELRVETSARDGGDGFVESLSLEGEPRPATARGQWQAVRVEFELPAGLHQVRASAREPATGKVGVVAQRVRVPDATGLRLSTPIVSDSVAAASPEASGPRPLAVAHRNFLGGAGRPLFCAFEVIGAATEPATGRSQVSVGFELANGDGKVVAALPGTALVPAADGRLRAVLALPLAELRADAYELHVTAEDHLASSTQTLREAFVVESAAPTQSWAGATPGSSAEGVPVPEALRGVLALAGQYVVEYEKAFSRVFAEESYHQEYTDPTGRRTVRDSRADVVFVNLPGPVPWTAFRDVIEVDGHPVGDREVLMKQLFLQSPGTAVEKARRILKESGRYNLGPLHRSVNFPTLALSFLLPESQRRFAFQDKGLHSLGDTEAIEVAYTEQASPTIVHDESGHDVPSRGRLFIDPRTGRVLRSVLEQDANGHGWLTWARIDVVYRQDPRLDILVPDSMTESYGTPDSDEPQAEARSDLDSLRRTLPLHIATVARYSAYGHFEVETQESFRPAEPSPR